MSFYLFHRKAETVYFSPTCGAMYPEERKTDSLFAQILTRLHILAPLPPPDNSIAWYQEELPLSKLRGAAPHLGLDPKSPQPGELARLHQLRAELWSICPDPWVGRWTFLNPGLSRLPWYDTIVSQVASGATVADLGCGVGLDLRQLADDASATGLYAVDSRPAIWAIGEKLFGPDKRLEFLEADLIDQLYETNLGSLKGKVDIVVACHLFDQHQYTGHLDVVHRVTELCHVGTRVVGYTLGATGQDVTVRSIFQGDYGYRYVHDPKSFRTVWNTIADRTESKWEYEVLETIELSEVGWEADDAKYAKDFDLKALHFVVKRIE